MDNVFLTPIYQLFLPTQLPQRSVNNTLDSQMSIFASLATNSILVGPLTWETLNTHLGLEATFYTCKVMRRLLLGETQFPFIHQSHTQLGLRGKPYEGIGLIISDGKFEPGRISTTSYLRMVLSLETTDLTYPHINPNMLRGVYCPQFLDLSVDYTLMFRIICKYITMKDMEECYSSFIHLLSFPLQQLCEKNYFKLLKPLLEPSPLKLPAVTHNNQLEFLFFNINAFLSDLIPNNCLSEFKTNIYSCMGSYPSIVMFLYNQDRFQDFETVSKKLLCYQISINQSMPKLTVDMTRKEPKGKPYRIHVHDTKGSWWLAYPLSSPIYRLCMLLSVLNPKEADMVFNGSTTMKLGHYIPLPKILTSSFRRVDLISKTPNIRSVDLIYNHENSNFDNRPKRIKLLDSFAHRKHVSINNFKMSVFNTNMVINTKLTCFQAISRYTSLLMIPRLVNNFVVKKFSIKEPSSTVSLFYSEDLCQGAAINVNISGSFLNFLATMGTIKCFLPIKTIYPISIANWNSALDLHGLENQQLVRSGRNDVFWTTNFPSVVSNKRGFNVSWFKAATATISKIHGPVLVDQISNEVGPIVTDKNAQIDPLKNTIFVNLEKRNNCQIQTLHKRFIECLIECCTFLRLNPHSIRHLTQSGIFDFSRRMISHTKSKHECALLGYKRCNLVPKIFNGTKKTRLDELGRNANFRTFIDETGNSNAIIKRQILRLRCHKRTI
ncbi:hypothetical protein [Saguinine gammaherpesvirus 1]|uniref:Herpesvirus UL87 C-terminal domain-containing protein n=1 Tax=Saguinine gammaherpesvirus 1 TaxID=2169901 RepID=A0A9Q8QY86_9GAMA|nr:hypothetical protein [Saguinine gammaherpesvirus 1]